MSSRQTSVPVEVSGLVSGSPGLRVLPATTFVRTDTTRVPDIWWMMMMTYYYYFFFFLSIKPTSSLDTAAGLQPVGF